VFEWRRPDRVVSVDVSRQIVETNKNSNVELIEVDGDGHNMESVTQTVMFTPSFSTGECYECSSDCIGLTRMVPDRTCSRSG
jgi:hypothetical protein